MKEKLFNLFNLVKENKITIEEAINKLKFLPYEDLLFAKIDTHRWIRKHLGEVIFCEGKTINQIVEIVHCAKAIGLNILATKATKEIYDEVKKISPELVYYETARIIGQKIKSSNTTPIFIITAGTADIPVAEEASVTAQIMGNNVEKLYDVGIAGLHRILDKKELLLKTNVIIVVAGMEGALPSIISGLTDKPIIAVPTSFGQNFYGLVPLFTMLNSCSPGVAVVNINNGFGAGYLAGIINKQIHKQD